MALGVRRARLESDLSLPLTSCAMLASHFINLRASILSIQNEPNYTYLDLLWGKESDI